MFLRTENLKEKKLIGKQLLMSFDNNKTADLWRSFMPVRKEIKNNIGTDLYSVELYDPLFFKNFNPSREFNKWAAIEVTDLDKVPQGMEAIVFPPGLYAVFLHKGPASQGTKTYQYIFLSWLPSSDFTIDHRPHFAVMGKKYKYEDGESEEEIWIPVKLKENG